MASLLMVVTCALLRVGVQRGDIPLSTDQFEVDAIVVTQAPYLLWRPTYPGSTICGSPYCGHAY